jgi:hypothetical protein
MYQKPGAALRISKDVLPVWSGVRGCPALPGGCAASARQRGQRNGETAMDASAMFVDCPAYMDKTDSVRCGLPAEVQDRYLMRSTDGPLESARIRCPRGHWFNGPVESLALEERPGTAVDREAVARLKGAAPWRRGG